MTGVDKKIGRSVRLTPEMNDRLVALCDHLGVTIHSYLANEVGKAISRDEVMFQLKKSQSDAMAQMLSAFNDAIQESKDS